MCFMIVPFILKDAGISYCLAVSPTLVLSLIFLVLYMVDQVHDLAEQLYLIFQIILNFLALFEGMITSNATATILSLFYCHLLVALGIDLYYVIKERGFALKPDSE